MYISFLAFLSTGDVARRQTDATGRTHDLHSGQERGGGVRGGREDPVRFQDADGAVTSDTLERDAAVTIKHIICIGLHVCG